LQTKSQQTAQLARRFFTPKHRSTQQREDHAEDLELNLSQMLHSFQLHSKACDFHLQTTQKACGFWRSALGMKSGGETTETMIQRTERKVSV